jgi:AcrR family transcriptional regulator
MTTRGTERSRKEFKRRGEPVVRRVLETTLDQLALVGFERLSIPAIAALAGVNKTSVYRRWPTKTELVRGALTLSFERAMDPPDTGNIRSDLLCMARVAAGFFESRRGGSLLRMLLAEGVDPDLRDVAVSMLREEEIALPRALKRAIERGELRRDTDTKVVLFTMVGALLHRVFIEQASVSEGYLQRLVDLLLLGACRRRPQRG